MLGWTVARRARARLRPRTRELEAPLRERVRGKTVESHRDRSGGAARRARLFVDNCAACHGRDARGNAALGAPDSHRRRLALRRRRQGDPDQHPGRAPWRDAARSRARFPTMSIIDLAHYVASLSGTPHDSLRAPAAGKPMFSNCACRATAPTARAIRRSARPTSPTPSGFTAATSREHRRDHSQGPHRRDAGMARPPGR